MPITAAIDQAPNIRGWLIIILRPKLSKATGGIPILFPAARFTRPNLQKFFGSFFQKRTASFYNCFEIAAAAASPARIAPSM
jgi:hypothetical protein